MEGTQKKMKLSRKVIAHPSFTSFFQNQTNTTAAQNFKEFNNTAGWLSVFFVFFFLMN
jgi:hypothetical protein